MCPNLKTAGPETEERAHPTSSLEYAPMNTLLGPSQLTVNLLRSPSNNTVFFCSGFVFIVLIVGFIQSTSQRTETGRKELMRTG